MDARTTQQVVDELRQRFGERVSTALPVREAHGHDESFHPTAAPDAVVFARTTNEVSEIVRICAAARVPMIPFGGGTSLEGHVAALHGGVAIDMSQMNRILAVRAEDLDCTVEAGVTRQQLNTHLRDMGLFFPVDPGAEATLGGMCATRASGTNAVRYGTMRDNVLALKAVMADGSIVETGGRARKSAAGYDLTRLLIGSEGTLGLITEATLKLYGIPEAIAAAVCPFATLKGAVASVIETVQMGLPVARIELLDEVQLDACNKYSGLALPLKPTLFLEFHGTDAGVQETALRFREIAEAHGAGAFDWATLEEDRNRLWKARHGAFYAALRLRPGAKAFTTDVCVPISRLAECLLETKADIDASPLLGPIVGHVGDGNFHVIFLVKPEIPGELEEAHRLNDRLMRRALAMGGTSTGEHGIGHGKIDVLAEEHASGVPVMRALKKALDPYSLLNPGKIFPRP